MTITFLVSYLSLHVIAAALWAVSAFAMWGSRDLRWVRGWHDVTRGLSVIFLGVTLLMVLPRHKTIFMGFGTELPGFTVLILQLSDLAIRWWPVLAVFVILAVAVETTLFELWLCRDDTVSRAKRCSVAVTGGAMLFLIFCQFSVVMPLIKILNDLS